MYMQVIDTRWYSMYMQVIDTRWCSKLIIDVWGAYFEAANCSISYMNISALVVDLFPNVCPP